MDNLDLKQVSPAEPLLPFSSDLGHGLCTGQACPAGATVEGDQV